MESVPSPYPDCAVCEILPKLDPAMVLYDGRYWSANLRENDQTLLGTSYITLKRHAPELDYLTLAEDAEFLVIRNGVMRAIRASFQPQTFNTSCLKNDAFKVDPDNTPSDAGHVHWHIKPRYGSEVTEVNGETFRDPLPGRYLSTFDRQHIKPQTALAIAEAIKNNLA